MKKIDKVFHELSDLYEFHRRIKRFKMKDDMNEYKAPIAVHPGETLKDILDEMKLSQAQLSGRTGLHVKTINEIIKGKNPITSETALKLSIVFGMSEGFWNNLQLNYEETVARITLEK